MNLSPTIALLALLAQPPAATPASAPVSAVPAGPTASDKLVRRSFESMSTRIDVSIAGASEADAQADVAAVRAIFEGVEARMNEWRPDAPLGRVNAAAGSAEPVAVPRDLLVVVRRGLEIGELTGGAFDITWAAMWGLWDFKAAKPRPPASDEVARRLKLIGFRRVQVDVAASTVRLPEAGMKIGLGGIAKGRALDESAAALRARGRRSFLLSAGGQVYAGGDKGGRPWRVGVRDPRGGPDDWFAFIDVTDKSVSTSGDYERYFIGADGVRYHHIIDPATGQPSRTGVRSATVVSGDATLADALSTALMIVPPREGLKLAQWHRDLEALLVLDDGTVLATPGLKPRLNVVRPLRP